MKKAFTFFIESIHTSSKNCDILCDGYDYAKINGKGYSFIIRNIKGPWILPSMGMKAITERDDQEKIIKYLVNEFNEMLKELDHKYSYFHHIDLRGKFPNDNEWDNEIHLKNSGFKKVAGFYHDRIITILNENPIEKYSEKLIV